MKKIFIGALSGLILAAVILYGAARAGGAPVFTYVYSESMEPLIRVNDAFLINPEPNYRVGDIIMYRPVILKAEYITHRIIGSGETGFITKGDNAPFRDQESGEPEVTADRIIGRVVTVNGLPVIIPGLGKLSSGVRSVMGKYSKYLSLLFLVLGMAGIAAESKHLRKPKPRRRLRLRHIYRAVVLTAVLAVIGSIYLGSRVTQVKYLVSEYPGTLGNQVEVNKPGELAMQVKNNGIIPVRAVLTGISPLHVKSAPEHIDAFSEKDIVIDVLPHRETGVYQGYVQAYYYPVLLPGFLIERLHRIHPALAVLAVGMSLGLYLAVLFKLLGHIRGLEAWLPVKAIRDKVSERRFKRLKAQYLGRKRSR